ncbi:MAG: flavin reductase family protein [Halioglobus sp.]|nr:flavin reductase family protein [Halioglobus sp.]
MQFQSSDIKAMDSRRRAAFINSVSGFKSANLVGTVNAKGQSNLAIMSSAVHLGSNPPLLALIIRPSSEEHQTLANILDSGCYSLNHVSASMVEQGHQTAAKYPEAISEFDATGLSPAWHSDFGAPMVAEASIKLGLTLREHHELEINGTNLVIGEVVLADVPSGCVGEDGALDLVSADTVALTGLDTYCRAATFKRMAYAKPHLAPQVLWDSSAQ